MASYTLSPIGGAGSQFFDNSGNVLSGGKLYTYAAGTTTPQTTWTTPAGTIANSNPIVFNSAGRPVNEIWLSWAYSYKFVLKDSNDVLIATYDNIPGLPQPAIANDASSISYEPNILVTAGSFVIGQTYMIASLGTTDFTAIGAGYNSTGIIFTASGAGTGTGTAYVSTTVETRLRAYEASGGSDYIGFLQSGTGALTTETVQDKLRETVSVKDFGAVGDGVTDDTAAIQAAIDSLFANNGASLYFPDGIYYLGSPVSINFDAQNSIRLHGSSTSNYFGFDTGGSRIIGAAGMESMFILTKTNLSTAGGYGFECDHIFFKSGGLGTTGPLTAIKNKIGGAPARPFVIANCGFVGFDKAVVSEIPAGGSTTTGICQVTIRESTFVANNYALYGSGNIGPIVDLLFTGNASENGGKIYISQLGGTCNISDNLLEGQADAIYITAGLAKVSIKRNYFEANTGYLMYVQATNPGSSCIEENNYITNCSGAKAYFRNMQLISKTDWKYSGVLFDAPYNAASSTFNNQGIIVPNSWGAFNYRFSLNSISKQTSVPPGTLTNGAYSTLGASSEVTPIGTVNFQSVTGNSSYMTPAAISLASGDAIVAMAIARRTSSNPYIYLSVFDNAYSPIGNSDTSQPLVQSAVGEWIFIAAIVKVSGSSAGAPRVLWVTSGGTADISSTYFYKVAAPVNNSTEAYFCMLNP